VEVIARLSEALNHGDQAAYLRLNAGNVCVAGYGRVPRGGKYVGREIVLGEFLPHLMRDFDE
jgi:hypothetical protein